MNLLIGDRGTALVDRTPLLDEASRALLTQEIERVTFQRVVDDLHLTLSNLDGTFTRMLKDKPATARFTAEVHDSGRRLFLGEVSNSDILFSVFDENVTMDVFSIDRLFWSAAKATRLAIDLVSFTEGGILYTTVQYILQRELLRTPYIKDLFSGFDIDPLFATRPIRGWLSSKDPIVTNDGRYRDLDRATTIYDLLVAMGFYYNAEFFISPETGKFTMARRQPVVNDTRHDISAAIVEDRQPEVRWLDEDKYDYILTQIDVPAPGAPKVTEVAEADVGRTGFIGIHSWMATAVIDAGAGLVIESDPGWEPPSLYVPLFPTAHRYDKVTMTVPLGPTATTRRNIYRQDWEQFVDPNDAFNSNGSPKIQQRKFGQPYLVGAITNNTATTFVDDYSGYSNTGAPTFIRKSRLTGQVWFGYDEAAGLWHAPIVDDGSTAPPMGRILDVTPKLVFASPTDPTQVFSFNIFNVIKFFGGVRDFDLSKFRDQWIGVLSSKRLLHTFLTGLNYRLGDSAVNPRNFPGSELLTNDLVLRKASNDLIVEETEAWMVTV